jgi:hypothetical protein
MASCATATVSRTSQRRPCASVELRKRRKVISRFITFAVMPATPPMLGEMMRPDAEGRFGKFGGTYVPETLIPALQDLIVAYNEAIADQGFQVLLIA